MSDKIRKYVLPNLPYLFVFWFFSKIGTAYRIAPGTDFGTKLMGMLDTFPKAFETYWPGLGGIDLLVGLAGAAGMYLLIQSKIRQAKKFRRDAEYGTARFGTKEDKNKTFKDVYGWGSSTICNILEKREYLGHTINFKTRKHFKDKKSHYVPEDEWTIFENTHEAIIDQQDL